MIKLLMKHGANPETESSTLTTDRGADFSGSTKSHPFHLIIRGGIFWIDRTKAIKHRLN